MTPRQLSLLVTTFSYGGNGGVSSTHPDVMFYILAQQKKWAKDERISRVGIVELGDTPITMARNKAVLTARAGQYDMLLMIDSDMKCDMLVGSNPEARPFWDSSFSFLYDHYEKGPVWVFAPYCGPPPVENVYVFDYQNFQSDNPDDMWKLAGISREEAYLRRGIEPVGAGPTGLILCDMRGFDVIEPQDDDDESFFYYEWTDKYASQKSSTEDVTATRDFSLMGIQQLGYNPLFCNWDAWAGHWKPKCVGKPNIVSACDVSRKMRKGLKRLGGDGERVVNFTGRAGAMLRSAQAVDQTMVNGHAELQRNLEIE